MMGNGMAGAGWLWVLLSWALSIALLVLLVLAIVWLARNVAAGGTRSTERSGGGGASESAREALDVRYAQGEISRDEYLQARRDLEGSGG